MGRVFRTTCMLLSSAAACSVPFLFPQSLAAGPDPAMLVSGLVYAVQARFGAAALDFARVLRRRWMGRNIALQAVPA